MECPRMTDYRPAWIDPLILNPNITDICINGEKAIYIDQGMGLEPLNPSSSPAYSESEIKKWIIHELSLMGKTWDAKHPFIDGTLSSGHRIHVAFPPLSQQGILVSLRRLSSVQTREIATSRWQDSPLYEKLQSIVLSGDSLLIAGATGSGKTTLLSDLLGIIPPHERIIALEDTPEIIPQHPHFISLVSRPANADGYGEVTLRMLLKQTLRMRPDRILLGECRGSEVLELLQALNTGHKGAMATLHANSPRDALRRIELLCLLSAGSSLSSSCIRELISLGIQWVAQVERTGPYRRVSELYRVEGREGDTILMRPMIK
ncbi:CpaF family protein [bacterium]|jgi:pilus assembly protein CpaF|nr:CpaF family protein [bacterium]